MTWRGTCLPRVRIPQHQPKSMNRTTSLSLAALALFPVSSSARNFFELFNQGFQNGERSGVPTESTFRFNGPIFAFEEPDLLGPVSGLVDDDAEGPTVWARILGGYDSNAAGFKAGDGAWFGGAQIGASENFTIGRQNVFVGARAKFVQFDGDIFRTGRDGMDSGIFDLDLRVGLNREFNESVALASFYNVNVGGTREFGQPFLLPGIDRQNLILLRAASQLAYRFDRAPVNDPGLQLTTALRSTALLGLDNDDRDFKRFEVRQSVDRILSPNLAVGVEGRAGATSWDDWDKLDSNAYYLLATASGRLGNGLSYHAAAGWEWWTYDDSMIDTRDDFTAELKVSGEITEQFYLAGGFTYGIESVRPARFFDTANPMGLKAALTGVWHNDLYSVAGLLTYTMFEADLTSMANGHWDRWSVGLSVDREVGGDSRVGVAFEYAGIDTHRDDFEDVETTLRWSKDF